MSLFETAEKYRRFKTRAVRDSAEDLSATVGAHYRVVDWSKTDLAAMEKQWPLAERKYPHWDWLQIAAAHRGPKDWCFALWCGDRLCGMAAAKMGRRHIVAERLECDPRQDCPLKRKRALITLDLVAKYGEYAGAAEMWLSPENGALIAFYETLVPIEPFPDAENPSYWRLEF